MESVLSTFTQNAHDFINSAPSNHFLQYMFEQFLIFVPYTSQAIHSSNKVLPPLPTFITLVARRSRSKAGTLLAAIVLMQGLKKKIDRKSASYSQDLILHDVVLGIVILTTKWLHDASPKNSRWAKYVGYYSIEEINVIEKKLLCAMDYQPKIPNEDFATVFEKYRCTISVHPTLISPDTIDQHHLPRSVSSGSLPRSSSNKSSSLYSLVQHLKWSIADFKKSPNNGKTKMTGSDRLRLPSKVAHGSPITRIHNESSGNEMPLGYGDISSESSSSRSNMSSIDLIQATNDIFLSLSQHISLSSLTSDSIFDADYITTPLAYPDNNDNMAILSFNKQSKANISKSGSF